MVQTWSIYLSVGDWDWIFFLPGGSPLYLLLPVPKAVLRDVCTVPLVDRALLCTEWLSSYLLRNSFSLFDYNLCLAKRKPRCQLLALLPWRSVYIPVSLQHKMHWMQHIRAGASVSPLRWPCYLLVLLFCPPAFWNKGTYKRLQKRWRETIYRA